MGLLRWITGISCALALAGFLFIMMVGKGLRSAYQSGAGVTDVVRSFGIYAIPLLIVAMLVAVFVPHARGYLHTVAVGVAAAMLGCIVIMMERPAEGGIYLCFFGLWMMYYAVAVY
jgi:hypothetical protein